MEGSRLAVKTKAGPPRLSLSPRDSRADRCWNVKPASFGYRLIAGSPVYPAPRGDDLLETGEVAARELRERYAKEFDFWKTDVKSRGGFASLSSRWSAPSQFHSRNSAGAIARQRPITPALRILPEATGALLADSSMSPKIGKRR
jgi:hypothetical protein